MKINKLKIIVFSISLIVQCLFSQGNYRIDNYGNRSILLNGNVTGSVEDLGLTYYNPSRLAFLEDPSFTVSGKAFEFNSFTLENALGENIDLKSSNFNSVPSMIASTFKLKFLPNDYFAYSFISRYRSKTNLSYDSGIIEQDVIQTNEDVEKFIARINLINDLKDEWIGLTWARKINDNFSVGISGFLSIYDFEGRSRLSYAALGLNQQSISYNNDVAYKQKTYGLILKLGASWNINKIEMGLNIHMPYINFSDKANFEFDEILAGFGTKLDIFNFNELDNLKNSRKTAYGMALGAGIPIGKSKIHTNIEWYSGVSKYRRIEIPELDGQIDEVINVDFNEELKPIFNFGIGAEIYVSPKVNGFASFSSDFSAYKTNANLFDIINPYGDEINYKTDYWHYGFGLGFELSWGNFIFGSTYANSDANFAQPINFPINGINSIENETTKLKTQRWRFIIGLEIPLISIKLK